MDPIEEAIRKLWTGAERLTYANARLWMPHIEDLAQKVGMSEPPRVWVAPNIIGQGSVGIVNAASIGKKDIVLTQPLIELFNCSTKIKPDKRLLAIVTHEMSHCKHSDGESAARRWPVLLGPAILMGGLYLYDKFKGVQDKDEKREKLDNKAKDLHGLISSAHANEHEQEYQVADTKHYVVDAGKYLAAGALGLLGGVGVTRYACRAREFRADKLAATFVGKQETAEGLKIVSNAINNVCRENGRGDITWWRHFKRSLLESYPTLQQRIDNIMR